MMSNKRSSVFQPIAVVVIIIVSIVAYSNTLKGGFVWDDRGSIVSNMSLRSFTSIPLFFASDQWKLTGHPAAPYYRPVINTFWLLEFQLWGENPTGYHATSIILHALLSVLFYVFCMRILDSEKASFFSALIFASHPVHVENVAWITGVGYIICAIFIVLTLLFYMRFIETRAKSFLAISALNFVLAVFSIEYALMIPFITAAYELLIRQKRVEIKNLIPFGLIILLYLIVRGLVISHGSAAVPMSIRVLTSMVIQAKYLVLFFVPYTLNVVYDIKPADTVLKLDVFASFLILVSAVFLMVYFYKKEKRALFALLWFFIILFPASNVMAVLSPQMMSLRYLYIPTMGLSMLSGLYIEKIPRRLKIIPVLIIVLLSVRTYMQNRYWHDEIALYKKMVADAPHFAIARNNLGVAYLEAGRHLDALSEFQTAVQLDPMYGYAVFNLGDTYRILNKFDEAIFYLRRAIEINPSDSRAYNSLGIVYKKMGLYHDALNEFNRSLTVNPLNYETHYNLGNLLYSMGRENEAVSHYISFLKLAPAKYASEKAAIEKMLKDKGIVF